MQVVRHQREMWVDGPPNSDPSITPPSSGAPLIAPVANPTPLGYGFMDQHKQGMIRQWVENQCVQVKNSGICSKIYFILFIYILFV